jgi:hypothetical protein
VRRLWGTGGKPPVRLDLVKQRGKVLVKWIVDRLAVQTPPEMSARLRPRPHIQV